ncbi:MAG: hypothetical protein GY810_20110, partial [Aureispira sp.]|nr:hypothetical protein [Aureispira sp.]
MFRCKKVSLSLLKMMFLGIFLMLGTYEAEATHALGGDLTYECIGPNQYRVTLALYRDCNGVNFPGSRSISWSGSCGNGNATANAVPGSRVDITPICPTQTSSCGGGSGAFGVEQQLYQVDIIIPAGCTNITFSWSLCCRNNAITTVVGSPAMYTETTLSDMTLTPCNSSPIFLNPPSAFTCVNDSVFYNHGAIDPDGDSLDFSLVPCQSNSTTNVPYVGGYSGAQPLGAGAPVSIDPLTGAIAFFPNATEVAVFCVLVREYRNGIQIGSVVRDIQFRVLGCTNQSPTVTGINGGTTTIDYTATACFNTQLCFDVTGSDPNGNNIVMYWNGAIPGATFTAPGAYGPGPVTGQFCWTPTAGDIGLNTFTVTIEDDACPLAGTNTFTYNINVISNPNTDIDAGPDVQICSGESTLLSAITTPNMVSYSWSPTIGLANPTSPATQAAPPSTTTYTVTTIYNDGCTSSDQVTVEVVADPQVSVFPAVTNVCASSSIILTANTDQAGMDVEWFDPSMVSLFNGPMVGTSSQLNVTVPAAAGSYVYTVVVTNPVTGCNSTETITLIVGTPPAVPECVNIYVDNGALASAAGTQFDPTSLVEALSRASCNNSVIKMDTGFYEIDSTMLITSFLTVEGGFQRGDLWTKTAEEGATTIHRTANNPDGVLNAQRLVAFAAIGSQGFRLQDFTITTDNGSSIAGGGFGASTYGVHLQSPSDYTIARVQVLPGNGGDGDGGSGGAGRSGAAGTHTMDGIPGVNGVNGAADPSQGGGGNGGNGGFATAITPGGAGGTTGGTQGSAGQDGSDVNPATVTQCTRNGGSGGGGGSGGCSNCTTNGNLANTGYDGGVGGRGGSSGPAGTCPSNPHFGTCGAAFSGSTFGFGTTTAGGFGGNSGAAGTIGDNGQAGEPGCPGSVGLPGEHISGFPFWSPGTQGQTGEHGSAGSGGGGGGGSGNNGGSAGNGGGGGGGGGAGGGGGTGGFGGGGSFGIYIVDNGANGNIIDCRVVVGAIGSAGVGGAGGTGGFGGGGGAASTANGISSGAGGTGGAGGAGGDGGDGQDGDNQNIYIGGTSAPLVAADSTHDFVTEPDIVAENVNCTNATVQFSDPTIGTGTGVTTWDFDVYTNNTVAGLETGTNNFDTTQYTTVGRYTIGHAGFNYEGFHNIAFDKAFKPTIMSSANMLSPDTFQLCVGDAATFSSDLGADTIIWNFNGAIGDPGSVQNVPSTVFNNPGFYEITLLLITDCCGDSPMDTAYLYVDPNPNPTASGDITMCRADSGSLFVTGLTALDTVIWTPTIGMDMIRPDSVVVAPTVSTTYIANVYSKITSAGQTRLSCPVPLTFNVTIQNPPEIDLSATDVVCEDDGTATVTVTNGTGPYRYEWSNGTTAQIPAAFHTITGQASGAFTVTVTDLGTTNSCDTSATVFIFPSAVAPDVTVNVTDVTCNGADDGQAIAAVVNGTAPFDYTWAGPTVIPATINVATQTATGLSPGNYSVTATDALGCTDTISFSITEPPVVTINTISTTDPICQDGNDGEIQIEGVGGTGAFTYTWNNGITSTTNSTGLLSAIDTGTYQITVTDANSCDAFTTITLAPQNIITTVIAITSPVPCNGDSATIEVNAAGGDGNYTYTWTGGSSSLFPTNQDLNANAAAGTYAVTVTDGNGCTTSTGITVTEPTAVTASISGSVSVTCFGAATGQATAAGSGGNPGAYSFQWDAAAANQTTPTATGLSAGIPYAVTVTDASGNCSDVTSVTLSQPATAVDVTASVTSLFNGAQISCFGANDGVITAVGSGGTAGYSYVWSNGQTDAAATALVDGVYTVTVTDANTCTDEFTVTITEPAEITTSIASSVSVSCNGDSTGQATVTSTGGTGAITYQWDASAFSQTNSVAVGLPTGTYGVTATDANSCTGTTSILISQPATPVVASAAQDNQTSCNGICDGQATASGAGGTVTTGYTFLWPATAANQTTSTATGLCAGTYVVSVTDNNICTDTVSVTITEPTAVTATIASSVSVSCNGGSDGEATASGSGGNGGVYTFVWNAAAGSQTTQTATGLSAGVPYAVTVTDGSGNCSAVTSVTLTEPAVGLSVTTNVFSDYNGAQISCFGASDAEIAAVPTGGTPITPSNTYTYAWSTGPNTDTITGQAAGPYTVTVTDANGCTATSSVTVTEPTAVTTTIASSVSVSCNGDSTGQATAAANGGTGAHNFTWDANAFNQTGTVAAGLPAGQYTVTAEDANNCIGTATVTISEPSTAVTAAASQTGAISCNGATDGQATAVGAGGTVAGAHTFTWDASAANQTTPIATGLSAGITYMVTVCDDNNCCDTASVVLTEPTAVTATITSSVSVSCNGAATGQATVAGSGGNGGAYTFQWDAAAANQTTATATGLSANIAYNVTVTDVSGNCSAVTSVTLAQPATAVGVTTNVFSNYNGAQVSCNSSSDAEIAAVPTGGTPVTPGNTYIYAWSTGPNTDTLTGQAAGPYTVTVTDANGCTATSSITVTEPTAVTATIASSVSVSCNGDSTGQANVNANGGTGAHTFTWDANAFNQSGATAVGLPAGSYTVTAEDANNCIGTANVTITQPATAVAASANQTGAISCNGASDGEATAAGAGGTVAGAYSFTWDANAANQTTPVATGLSAGVTYIVTVCDANSCCDTVSIVLTEPSAVTATISANVSVSCNGGSNGQATVAGSGGNGGAYTFQWDAAAASQTTATATGLQDGTYFVTVTDVSGNCTGVTSVTIAEPATAVGVTTNVFSNYNGAQVSCNGASDGEIAALPTGGTPFAGNTYVYAWSTGPITDTITGQAAGPYTVTVTDANGCTATSSITVTEPTAITTSIASSVSISCNGDSTGQATAAANGGTGAHNFTWDANAFNQTGLTAVGLPAGSYTVTAEDANNCIGTATVTITEPSTAVSAAASQTGTITCNGGSDGEATAVGAGGTVAGAYAFTWDANAGNQTTPAATGLSAGITYMVTICDDNNCCDTASVILTEPTAVTASISSNISVSCNGGTNGQATAAGSGGDGAYTFQWDATAASQTTATATGLGAGTYFVTVSDGNMCSAVVSATIAQPATAVAVTAGVVSDYNGAQISCNGASDGIVIANASGGTVAGTYTYTWSPALPGTDTIFNAPAGNYAVTITDDNGCTVTSTTTVTAPSAVVATIPTSVSVACFGGATGSATANGAGGTVLSNYTFLWDASTGNQNTATATALTAGTYTVTITDANNCNDVESIVIGEPATAISVSTVVDNNASCNGATDGGATATGVGGTGTITYLWTPSGQTTASATGLGAGQYIVVATDANNCTAADTIDITEPTPVVASISATVDVACFGDATGTATAAGAGGTIAVAYTFQWDAAATNQTTSTATGLTVGSYDVTVTDDNGCSDVVTANITEPTLAVTVGATVTSNFNGAQISCNGATDGEATANGSGGTGTLDYQWDVAAGGQITAVATGLGAGNYCVTVTDDNGCTATTCVTISEPNAVVPSVTNIQNVNCRGASTGEITVAATGGTTTSGYTFQWDAAAGNQTTPTAIGLIAGNYCVTVTDANGCTAQICDNVTEPASNLNLAVSVTSNYNGENVSCFGAADGEATAVANGGTGIITYAWNVGGQTGPVATALADGSYCVTATDAVGCSESICVTLTEPTQITVTTAATIDVACKDDSTGLATVSATGGTAPTGYTFLWDNTQALATATGLADGIYSVTATDINGCIGVGTVLINEPVSAINATAVVTSSYTGQDISCFGNSDGEATASAIGGTVAGAYTFQWSSGTGGQTTSIAGGLVAGAYVVTVTDDNGCSDTAQVALTQPSAVLALITDSVDVNCFGDATGALTVAGSGGTGAGTYTFQWEVNANNQITATATGLTAGSYNVTVTDANGCNSIGIGVVDQPSGALDVDINITSNYNGQQISCNGATDGSAEAVVTDGTAPYDILWSVSGNTNAAISNLGTGTYVVTVTDAQGCTDTAQVTFVEPSLTAVSIIAQSEVGCRGDSTGTATAEGTGGIGNFTYVWSHNAQTTVTATGLPAGSHSVTATDDNGCEAVTTVIITEPATSVLANALVTSDYNGSQISCTGETDGEALASGNGGTIVTAADYTYQWSASANSQLTETATSLPAGTHTVTVSDLNGCSDTVSITITEPTTVTATISATNDVLCAGDATGSATAAGTGGTAPLGYTFEWDVAAAGQTTPTATGLAAGSYNVTVTDANGCNSIAIAVISAPAAAVVATGSVTSNYTGFDISCNGAADGVALATVTGGDGTYTYQWSVGSYTTATATGLADGTYTVTVTDGNGCTDTTLVTVTEPAQIVPSIIASTEVNCFGDATGDATVDATGGTGAGTYTFEWDAAAAGQTTATATGLAAGLYEVTVTDANGCTGITNVTIGQPTGPVSASALVTSDYNGSEISCNGATDGEAEASGTGGTVAIDYTYQWSGSAGSQATAIATGLPAGTHIVTVTDDLGCSEVAQVTVTEPSVVVAQISSTVDIACTGDSTGVATATGTGGTVATVYNFLWEDGQTGATATGLGVGSYNVTIEDDNGCQSIATAVITAPASAVTASATVTSNHNGQQISCAGAADGTALVSAAGGDGSYDFLWSASSQTTTTATGLADGTYTVTVTDGNGCSDTAQVTVVEPTQVVASITSSVDVNCFGDATGSATVGATGGTTPYTFLWDASTGSQATAMATGLIAGLYEVTVTDANGCTGITNITINQPTTGVSASVAINSNYNGADVSCNGATDGEAEAIPSGGTVAGDYTYQWSGSTGNQATAIATGLGAGTHIVTVTDDLGCSVVTQVTLTEPSVVVAQIASTIQIACTGDSTGVATASGTGGTIATVY